VACSPDGTRIVSGSRDKTLRIWDAISGAPIGEPQQGHTDRVWSVAFSPDSTCIISGADDKTIRIWNVKSVASLAFSPHSTLNIPSSRGIATQSLSIHAGPGNSISPMQHTAPILSDASRPSDANARAGEDQFIPDSSILRDDGWLTTAGGHLLFWIPPENHPGLFRPSTLAIIGGRPIRLDMQRFVHGPQWMLCKTGDC